MEFDPYNLDEIKRRLSTIMLGFREWIETKRRQEFFNALIRGLAVVGLITIIGEIAGALFGSSKNNEVLNFQIA